MKHPKLSKFLLLLFFLFPTLIKANETPLQLEKPVVKSNWYYAGYSALLPGLGQYKKDRQLTGLFFFSAFTLSAANWYGKYETALDARQDYQTNDFLLSAFNISLDNNASGTIVKSILYSHIAEPYSNGVKEANTALLIIPAVYLIQIIHAYFASSGNEFVKKESNTATSGFEFKTIPTRSIYGGGGYTFDVNYIWRF